MAGAMLPATDAIRFAHRHEHVGRDQAEPMPLHEGVQFEVFALARLAWRRGYVDHIGQINRLALMKYEHENSVLDTRGARNGWRLQRHNGLAANHIVARYVDARVLIVEARLAAVSSQFAIQIEQYQGVLSVTIAAGPFGFKYIDFLEVASLNWVAGFDGFAVQIDLNQVGITGINDVGRNFNLAQLIVQIGIARRGELCCV